MNDTPLYAATLRSQARAYVRRLLKPLEDAIERAEAEYSLRLNGADDE